MEKIPQPPAIGADIETFLLKRWPDKTRTYDVVPCVNILKGTKDKPFPLDRWGAPGCYMQEDNVMAEWNIPVCREYFEVSHFVELIHSALKNYLEETYPGEGYSVHFGRGRNFVYHYRGEDEPDPRCRLPSMSWARFSEVHLRSKQAQTIGCDPDLDAYTGGNTRVWTGRLTNVRSCGGHIHLGGDFQCPDFVAALFAELFLTLWGDVHPGGKERAAWYGQPGIYRSKPYGIEYRTPSNSWISNSHTCDVTANAALSCAKFLTCTAGEELHAIFRKLDWPRLRNVVLKKGAGSNVQGDIRFLDQQAKELGVKV